MEPRIATLLGSESFIDRTGVDQISILPPPSVASRRPLPVEPADVGDNGVADQVASRVNDGLSTEPVSAVSRQRPRNVKSAVPLAEVLNDEEPGSGLTETVPAPATFGGSISDVLVDTQQRKRRKLDCPTGFPNGNGYTGSDVEQLILPFTLPRPQPSQQKRSNRRPRIPPLLQGLHQPPPNAGLFPPITGDKGGFREVLDNVPAQRILQQSASAGDRVVDKPAGPREEHADRKHVAGDLETAIQPRQQKPKAQKRNKWTEQETKDLLKGVGKHGIGKWKKILLDNEFDLDGRTSVDLKDRFRTCCSEYYRKSKTAVDVSPTLPPPSQDRTSSSTSDISRDDLITKVPSRKPRSGTDRKGPDELSRMGIITPFSESKRRERRHFTDRDDAALLEGFLKYGAKWHVMLQDPQLGFQDRRPTDLRDRFRNRYPERFVEAGYKLRAKQETGRHKELDASNCGSNKTLATTESNKVGDRAARGKESRLPSSIISSRAPESPPTTHKLPKPLIAPFPPLFDEFPDLVSEDDVTYSPITLNRNIFQWADANPSQHNVTASSTYASAASDGNSHLGPSILAGADHFHINPLATLKLPSSMIAGTSFAPNQNATTIAPANIATSLPTSGPAYNYTPASKPPQDALLLTPNLPTIIFPNVPASSARSGVLNLPPPTELFSTLEHSLPYPDGPSF